MPFQRLLLKHWMVHNACLVCDDKIYVEDEFLDDELGPSCGTYVLADTYDTGMKISLN